MSEKICHGLMKSKKNKNSESRNQPEVLKDLNNQWCALEYYQIQLKKKFILNNMMIFSKPKLLKLQMLLQKI